MFGNAYVAEQSKHALAWDHKHIMPPATVPRTDLVKPPTHLWIKFYTEPPIVNPILFVLLLHIFPASPKRSP